MQDPSAITIDFLALFQAAPGNHLVLLPDAPRFTIVAASDGYLEATATTRSQVINQSFPALLDHTAFINLPAHQLLLHSLQQVIEHAVPDQLTIRENGTPQALQFSHKPLLAPNGGIQFIIHTLEKRTEIKHTDRQARAEQEQLKEAQAVGHVGSFVWEVGSNVSLWSDELYRINGLEPQSEEITLDKVDQFIHPDDYAALQALKETSLHQPGNYKMAHRIIRRDGKLRWVNHQWESIAGTNGTVIRVTGIVQDITEQHNAQ